MSGKTQELYDAATALLPFLQASTDECTLFQKALERKGETRAQRLRREADDIEAKDAAIQRFRAAVAAFQGERDNG